MPVISQIEICSKEDILKVVRKQKCKMLRSLKLSEMTREQIIEHLLTCNCPVIKKLIETMIFS